MDVNAWTATHDDVAVPEQDERTGLVDVVHTSDARKSLVMDALRRGTRSYGNRGQFSGVLDAYHGETNFGLDEGARDALDTAWRDLVAERASFVELDGKSYDKKSPRVLRELAARHLFDRLNGPAPGVPGTQVHPEEVLVCPYSSTVLLEEALATVARPGGRVLSPEGFYKSNALHVNKAGLEIDTMPAFPADEFKMRPEALRQAIRASRRRGPLCALLLTMPGNPLLVDYSASELQALAQVIVEEDVRVICDASFDKLYEHIPLASISVTVDGKTVSLYDRVLTVTGNSKGFGAFGPCKFGAACTGDAEWRQAIRARLTVAFQRETTHLVRAVLENTTGEYLARNRETMRWQQRLARQEIRRINDNQPGEPLRVHPKVAHGMFLNLEFDRELMEQAGVTNSLELEDFLLLGQGINSTCFARMGSDLLAVRLNVLAPRKGGEKNPHSLAELFNRIDTLLSAVRAGLTYAQLLRENGVPPMRTPQSSRG